MDPEHEWIVHVDTSSGDRHRRGVSRCARRGQLPFLAGAAVPLVARAFWSIVADSVVPELIFKVKVAVCILDQIVAIADR